MATLCAGVGGRLIRIGNVNNAVPLSLSLAYGTGGPVNLVRLGVATAVQAEQRVLAQFQNTLSDSIFVTPFGDAPGKISVSFVANRECGDEDSSGYQLLQHYLDKRLLPGNSNSPAIVTVGSAPFRAFLTNMLLSGSTSDMPVVQGTLVFTAWPLR